MSPSPPPATRNTHPPAETYLRGQTVKLWKTSNFKLTSESTSWLYNLNILGAFSSLTKLHFTVETCVYFVTCTGWYVRTWAEIKLKLCFPTLCFLTFSSLILIWNFFSSIGSDGVRPILMFFFGTSQLWTSGVLLVEIWARLGLFGDPQVQNNYWRV